MDTLPVKCLLCKEKIGDKANSHILPKFFKKVIHYNNAKKHAIELDRKLNTYKPVQDIPKEDFILCTLCEKRFELLETLVSINLNQAEDLRHFENNPRVEISGLKYQILKGLSPKLFNLFVLSMLWRMSISKHLLFKDFTPPSQIVENLRSLLDYHLSEDKEVLKEKMEELKVYNFPFVIIRPHDSKKCTWSLLVRGDIRKGIALNALKYNFLIYPDENSIPESLLPVANYSFRSSKVMVISNKDWNNLNTEELHKLINNPK